MLKPDLNSNDGRKAFLRPPHPLGLPPGDSRALRGLAPEYLPKPHFQRIAPPADNAYCGVMEELPVIAPGEIVLLHTPTREAMALITTGMALAGPVHVLDTGNRFDAYGIARLVRRQTVEVDRVLGRIQVARAFTCYQVVTLFEQLPDAAAPYIVFDLLATFYDESVSLSESYRLLNIVLSRLKRLRRTAPVVVSLYPHPRKQRPGLAEAAADIADRLFTWEASPVVTPTRLF